jgi:hypothetical protein
LALLVRTEARVRLVAFVLGAVPAAMLALSPVRAHAQVAATACGGDFEAALARLVAMPPAAL